MPASTTRQSTLGGISVLIDYNSVTIMIAGRPNLVLTRPATVGTKEWEEFWDPRKNLDQE